MLVICYKNDILKPMQWIRKIKTFCITTFFRHILQTKMVMTLEYGRFKYKINGIKKTKNTCRALILIIYWWKIWVKKIERNYHSVTWIFKDIILHLKYEHLVVRPKQGDVPECNIKILVPKTPRSRLVHILYW